MLDQEFCDFLEYRITHVLKDIANEEIRGFWCDGVLLPSDEDEYSKKQVNDKRSIVMTAFAGKTGQDEYKLILQFGPKALSRYSRELSLEECLPAGEDSSWLDVDVANNRMTVRLD